MTDFIFIWGIVCISSIVQIREQINVSMVVFWLACLFWATVIYVIIWCANNLALWAMS